MHTYICIHTHGCEPIMRGFTSTTQRRWIIIPTGAMWILAWSHYRDRMVICVGYHGDTMGYSQHIKDFFLFVNTYTSIYIYIHIYIYITLIHGSGDTLRISFGIEWNVTNNMIFQCFWPDSLGSGVRCLLSEYNTQTESQTGRKSWSPGTVKYSCWLKSYVGIRRWI